MPDIYLDLPVGATGGTVAKAIGTKILIAPFEDVRTVCVWEQEYEQLASSFAPLAFNTAHPDDGTFFLVRETEPTPFGAGLVHWKRTYAKCPGLAARELAEQYVATFWKWGPGTVWTPRTNRPEMTQPVVSRLVFDYYRLDGVTYSTPRDIPLVARWYPYVTALGANYLANFLDATTTPTLTAYLVWVDAASWANQIAVEASTIRLWMGNIWERQTRYVLPI